MKTISPAWHGWMHYQYDDPPKEENFVNPFYRSHKTPVFKTDHPDQALAHFNQGHLLHSHRVRNMKEGQQRMYTEWEPPTGGEARHGKKIIMEKPKNDGAAHQEQD